MKTFSGISLEIFAKVTQYLKGSKYISLHVETDSVKEFLEKLDEFSGVRFRYFHKVLSENYPRISSTSFSTSFNNGDQDITFTAGANEYDPLMSILKAEGEILERLSSYLPLQYFKKYKSNRNVVGKFLPETFLVKNYFSFGYTRVRKEEVYWGLKNESKKVQSTSNGIAGHFDKNKAILNAWLELIERDSFLVYWLNTISPKKINIDAQIAKDDELKKVVDNFKKYNLEYYFLDCTSDIAVPVSVCAVVDRAYGFPRVAIGASSGFDGAGLLIKASTEALLVMSHMKKESSTKVFSEKSFSDNSLGLKERANLYQGKEVFEKFRFFIEATEEIAFEDFRTCGKSVLVEKDDTKKQLRYLKKIFKDRFQINKDYKVTYYSYENSLLNQYGYYVIRVLCPALYGLYLRESYADLHHPRLKEFVTNKGLVSTAKLNVWPHPFA